MKRYITFLLLLMIFFLLMTACVPFSDGGTGHSRSQNHNQVAQASGPALAEVTPTPDNNLREQVLENGEIALPFISIGDEPNGITPTPTSNTGPTETIVPTIGPTTDSNDPIPIDNGNGSYKGLPLRLQDNGAPQVTAVDGVIGVVCIGMSNAFIECRDYIQTWLTGAFDGEVNPQVKFINCARPSRAIESWIDPQFDEELWDECKQQVIPGVGYRTDQIRVIWHKAADMEVRDGNGALYPLYPDPDSDFYNFYENLTAFAARVHVEFPSVQAVYSTSRSYGGFSVLPERGEPLSYEEGHALNQWLGDIPVVDGVWYGWGPYIWAPACSTGDTNGSGVCYELDDFQNDGIHPDVGASEKIVAMMHNRFMQFDWYSNE